MVQITDIIAAGRIFRALDPKCCPRCDALVTEARRRKEEDANACAMCGETMHADDDGEAALAAAKKTAARSKSAVETHRALCREAERKATAASEEVARCEAAVTALEGLLKAGDRRGELTLAIARLEARIEEIRRPVARPPGNRAMEIAIVSAAAEECDARVKEKQEAVLAEVSRQIVDYARRFGMLQLSEAKLKGNAHLDIVKGGKAMTFGAVTVGEKLRLKIATVLAILKSGERRGIGRHPGLLFIDSPGAQELADDNLEDLMRELKAVSAELKHLQVFVAAIASPPSCACRSGTRVAQKGRRVDQVMHPIESVIAEHRANAKLLSLEAIGGLEAITADDDRLPTSPFAADLVLLLIDGGAISGATGPTPAGAFITSCYASASDPLTLLELGGDLPAIANASGSVAAAVYLALVTKFESDGPGELRRAALLGALGLALGQRSRELRLAAALLDVAREAIDPDAVAKAMGLVWSRVREQGLAQRLAELAASGCATAHHELGCVNSWRSSKGRCSAMSVRDWPTRMPVSNAPVK